MRQSFKSAMREVEPVERVALWVGWLLVLALMFTAPAGTKAYVIVVTWAAGCILWTGCVYLIVAWYAITRVMEYYLVRWMRGRILRSAR